ncbi:MAG TPA: translation initiation factor IF-1A [Candidatus Woesearchaeota archaeon]|nr:translation initiation factor IF-1A [Candidatus Woesearchaeota archaeon]
MAKREKSRFAEGSNEDGEPIRVRLPEGRQVLGILETRLGGSRSRVICSDGKVRVCRIPGRLKRDLWVRPNDLLIIEPWEFDGDSKGDVLYKYRRSQVDWLRKRGFLKPFEEMSDF